MMGARIVRPFSAAEDASKTQMRIDQTSLGYIATALGRAKSSIQKRLEALARKDEEAFQ
jgi:hypothetical protein